MATNLKVRDSRRAYPVVQLGFAIIVAILMFFPFYLVILGGFKTNGQLFIDPLGLPNPAVLEPYAQVLGRGSEIWGFVMNSVIIAGGTILITLVCSMAAGVALSRIDFPGRGFLRNLFIMGLLFPLTVAILPLYLQLRSYGLLGTRFGVIIAQAAFALPLSIFIFTGFFRDIPQSLQDAVEIDGGNIFVFATRVLVPLSAPVVTTVTIITLIQSWNQFLLPLLVLTDLSKYTIPLGVMQFQGQYTTGWNLIMAFIMVTILPVALFYFTMQRYVVAGLTAGAVKG